MKKLPLLDRFAFWMFRRRADSLAARMIDLAPERTMELGMTLVEGVLAKHPEVAMAVVNKHRETWGLVKAGDHVHTAECSGQQVH